jgi:O-antigen ligase
MPLQNHLDKANDMSDHNAIRPGLTDIKTWPARLLCYGGFFTVLLLATTYFSTSLSTISSIIVGLLWLFSGQFKSLPKVLQQYPVATWSLALFVCFMVGLSYGSATMNDALSMLKKYRELIFIPILIPFLRIERHRDWAWKTFIIASILTLIGSYIMETGVFGAENQLNPSFKSRITHSIFIAFFAFFCLHKAVDDAIYKWAFIVLFGLCLGDLFFVVQGRTGQLIVVGLILLFTLQRLGNKGRLLTVIVVILSLTLFVRFSDKAERIYEGVENTSTYLNNKDENKPTSMGVRYKFWENSLKLVAEKPWFGHGTGSFADEYKRITDTHPDNRKNPHNEFLLIAVQLGLLGFLTYSGFLISQYYCSITLPEGEKWLAQGLLLTLVITSLFNSPFLDHTEGHWFAFMIALCFAPNSSDSKFCRQWSGWKLSQKT